jgi:hypothetical protein
VWTGEPQGAENDLIGIEDPLRDHELFAYSSGGIPADREAAPPNSTRLLSAVRLPVWSAPREIGAAPGQRRVMLPDGRTVGVLDDHDGRVEALRWPSPHGRLLRTTITYHGPETTVTDPFGVSRRYERERDGDVREVVPSRVRRGAGYRPSISGVLDGMAPAVHIQDRWDLVGAGSAGQEQAGAGLAWAGASYDGFGDGGYLDIALTSLTAAPRVIAALTRQGLLDITDIQPALISQHELDAADDGLNTALTPLLDDCHIVWGESGPDIIDVTVATTITPSEVAILDSVLRRLPAWAIIEASGASVCATALAGAVAARADG